MFIQVIQGSVSDPAAVRRHFDAWDRDLAPGATGWIGSTAGVSPDGEFVAVVRFTDEAAARANSDRPEQGAWWEAAVDLFDGEPTFHDYPDTTLLHDGGSDDAGFVQVIQGTYTGDGSPGEMMDDADDEFAERRPDVIGASLGWDASGHFTETVYFTSEAEAREAEARTSDDGPPEWAEDVDGLSFIDLTDPWLVSP